MTLSCALAFAAVAPLARAPFPVGGTGEVAHVTRDDDALAALAEHHFDGLSCSGIIGETHRLRLDETRHKGS
jgi:hypothetical protein